MSDRFDPYHIWLGIPPKDQPPNHYRLLGINVFEEDPDVIEHAADQRMAHVRSVQSSDRLKMAQKILNQIASARVCLLHAADKEAYDQQLRGLMDASQTALAVPPTKPPVTPPATPTVLPSTTPPPPRPAPAQRPQPAAEETGSDIEPGEALPTLLPATGKESPPAWQMVAAVAIVGVGVIVSIALVMWAVSAVRHRNVAKRNLSDDDARSNVRAGSSALESPPKVAPPLSGDDEQQTSEASAGQTDTPTPVNANGGDDHHEPEKPGDGDSSNHTADPPVNHESPANGGSETGTDGNSTEASSSASEQGSTKTPVPTDAAQARFLAPYGEMLADRSASQILAVAQSEDMLPTARFAVLVRAKDTAASAGEVSVALHVVDRLAAEYEVAPLEMKTEILAGLTDAAAGPVVLGDVARASLILNDEATAGGSHQIAQQLAELALRAARKANETDLSKIAAYRLLKLREPTAP